MDGSARGPRQLTDSGSMPPCPFRRTVVSPRGVVRAGLAPGTKVGTFTTHNTSSNCARIAPCYKL